MNTIKAMQGGTAVKLSGSTVPRFHRVSGGSAGNGGDCQLPAGS